MITQLFEKSVLVFGCGNILYGDDGFGPEVIKNLKENYALPDDILLMDVGTSIRDILFDLVLSEKKPRTIIIIDAVDYPNRTPGEIFEIPVEGIPETKVSDFSLHQFPTVNMLKELKDNSQIDIRVIVAQIEDIPAEVKPGLSTAVAKAISLACDRIVAAIHESG